MWTVPSRRSDWAQPAEGRPGPSEYDDDNNDDDYDDDDDGADDDDGDVDDDAGDDDDYDHDDNDEDNDVYIDDDYEDSEDDDYDDDGSDNFPEMTLKRMWCHLMARFGTLTNSAKFGIDTSSNILWLNLVL